MICAISDANKKRFLTLMVVDVLEAARSGQPFSTEKYIKDTYKLILDRTADRAKAQTFASFIPGNLISIFAANKEAGKYLTPSIAELATLRETFEDFDSVGTYLGIGQEAAQTKKQEIVETNEASLRVEEDPTAGASPAVVAGTAKPTNKSSISTNFKAAGKSALTAFNVVSSDPIILASENFVGKYHQAQKSGSAEYQGLKLKVVPARSIIADLPQSEREFLENTPSYEGVKAIIVNADNTPVRIDSQGNIAEEGMLAQYMLNRPELVDGVFVRKTETPISEVASALGVDESVAQEARQKEYRILYNIRKALEQDPNREIYVGINTSAGFSVSIQYDNPVSLGDINFKALGEEFIPYVGDGERGTESGHAYFNLSFSSKPLPIDRPGITSVIPAETLAKYIFDQSIPLATRTEVFERLLYIGKNIPKIRLREGKILYNGESVTEDIISSVLKSVNESAKGSVNSTYRANVPLNTSTTIDIPYYDQNGKVQYNTLEAVDYLKKYFTTPARLEETTAPYFNLDITPEEQIAFQADVERLSEQTSKTQLTAVQDLSDLFESNPELANAVYEALGFKGEKIIETAKGSTYRYLPSGKTQRFKKVEGKEYEPQDILTFVPNYEWIKSNNPQWLEKQGLENDTQYTQYLLEKVQGKDKVWIVDSKGKKIETNQDAKIADKLFIAFGKKDGTVEDFIPVSKEPVIGFYTYDSRIHFDEKGERYRDRHLGNKVVKITEGITPQQKQQAQQIYSQYLDTIFPYSKVKDIVYHGANEPIEGEKFAKREGATGRGIWFSGSKRYATDVMNRAPQSESLMGRKLRGAPTMYQVLLNIKNPAHFYNTSGAILAQSTERFLEGKIEDYRLHGNKQYDKNTNDAALFHHPNSKKPETSDSAEQVVVFEPEQIHILGSKQDIEGFKEFVTQPSTSVKEGVSEQKVPKTSNSAKPISLQLDLISLSDQVANQLKEDIISKGLGATFNIQESIDSDITETISKGKQNSCK